MAHALLSPSSAGRWLECTPSARLEAEFPDRAGDAADEGTLAHRLGELLIKNYLKRIKTSDFQRSLKSIEVNKFYSDSMYEYCDQYAVFVIEQYNEALEIDKNAELFLEVHVDLTEYIPEGFGTSDAVILSKSLCHVIDLKYGKGVKVDALNNKQMMLYAFGVLKMYEMIYTPDTVYMTIYQPRIDNFSTWPYSVIDLYEWAETELIPKAALAWKGKGEFVPGPHCNFCRVKQTCKANADYQMELAVYEFTDGPYLDPDQIADILSRAAPFINWISSVKKYALLQALNGTEWPGFKVVQGKSRRFITDPAKAIKLLKAKGWDTSTFLSEPELLGIGALEKNMTKAVFNKTLGKYVDKKEGQPALVPETDSRPAFHSSAEAAKLFEQFDDYELVDI